MVSSQVNVLFINIKLVCYLLVLCSVLMPFTVDSWSYDFKSPDGPDHWSQFYPKCNDALQSPINIDETLLRRLYTNEIPYGDIRIVNSNSIPLNVTLLNNGKSFFIIFEYSDKIATPYLTGGVLNDNYLLYEIHFHFGRLDSNGSEHSVAHNYGALEMHIVGINEKYHTDKIVTSHPDSVIVFAVIGNMFDKGKDFIFTKYLKEIRKAGSQFTLTECDKHKFTLHDLLPNDYFETYYYYWGTTTTPPCKNPIQWIVIRDYSVDFYVTTRDIRMLRSLERFNGESLAENRRMQQRLDDRIVIFVSP